jgi:hypothetical protein
MSAAPAAKRARARALDAAVSTLEVPELGDSAGLLVLADGTRLVSTSHTLQLLTPAGLLATLAEYEDAGFEDGKGANARFRNPASMTVDAAGHIVVADVDALRRVSKAGRVSTLAGNGYQGFADGQGDAARFNRLCGMALADNDDRRGGHLQPRHQGRHARRRRAHARRQRGERL